jgi:hypothetical protein
MSEARNNEAGSQIWGRQIFGSEILYGKAF